MCVNIFFLLRYIYDIVINMIHKSYTIINQINENLKIRRPNNSENGHFSYIETLLYYQSI